MTPQLHKILISLIVVGMIVSGMVLFFSNLVGHYGVEGTNVSEIESLNRMTSLSEKIEQFENESTGIGEDEKFDILGGFFKSAYQSGQVLKDSVKVSSSMLNESIDSNKQNLGGMGNILKGGLGLIITVIIIIGIFLAFITKSNRT